MGGGLYQHVRTQQPGGGGAGAVVVATPAVATPRSGRARVGTGLLLDGAARHGASHRVGFTLSGKGGSLGSCPGGGVAGGVPFTQL